MKRSFLSGHRTARTSILQHACIALILTATLAANATQARSIYTDTEQLAQSRSQGERKLPKIPELPEIPEPAANEFHFVVLGDSQFDAPSAFNRMIDDIARLRPAFVIQVGDLIDGYVDSPQAFSRQWSRFANQIQNLAPIPFMPVAGNHDLYNSDRLPDVNAQRIYQEHWGALYYQFSYRNALFVVLNSDPVGAPNMIDSKQMAWLQETLQASSAPHKFVFLHRPPRGLRNADGFHNSMVLGNVDTVFYGHYHHHHFEARDGVRYLMTNASGATPIDYNATGSYSHFLQVAVRDDSYHIAAIRADAVEAIDQVTPDDNQHVFRLNRAIAPLKHLSVEDLKPVTQDSWELEFELSNPTPVHLQAYLQWHSEDERWHIAPAKGSVISLPPAPNKTTVSVILSRTDKLNGHAPESWPVCDIEIPYLTSTGQWVKVQSTLRIAQKRSSNSVK